VTVTFLRRTLQLGIKLVLTCVTRFCYRDSDKIMKWMREVGGKAVMSTESVGGLSGNVGEAKCKVGHYKDYLWAQCLWHGFLSLPPRLEEPG
jgi:hypothetical protein